MLWGCTDSRSWQRFLVDPPHPTLIRLHHWLKYGVAKSAKCAKLQGAAAAAAHLIEEEEEASAIVVVSMDKKEEKKNRRSIVVAIWRQSNF